MTARAYLHVAQLMPLPLTVSLLSDTITLRKKWSMLVLDWTPL